MIRKGPLVRQGAAVSSDGTGRAERNDTEDRIDVARRMRRYARKAADQRRDDEGSDREQRQ